MAGLKFLILITVFVVLLDINLEHEIEFMHNLTDTLSFLYTDLSATTQQADELPCYGSTAL
jgi:hypothetical protein